MQSPYDISMESQQPLGQPINANPEDTKYVPQPLDSGSKTPGSSKKMWIIIASVVGILLLLGAAYWFMSKNAVEAYKKDAATYKQELTEVRDAMNTELDEQNIGASSPKAPPIFEDYGKQMQETIKSAPKPSKVFGFLPVSGGQTKQDVDKLTAAATNYANQLRYINELYIFYTTVAADFKPIKDLGTFTVRDADKIKALPGLWETFLNKFKALQIPSNLETLRADLIAQGEELYAEFKILADGFDGRTQEQNDQLVKDLKDQTVTFNDIFQQSARDVPADAIDKVNAYYDELDKLLQ